MVRRPQVVNTRQDKYKCAIDEGATGLFHVDKYNYGSEAECKVFHVKI